MAAFTVIDGGVTLDFCAKQRAAFRANPQLRLARNAMTRADPLEVLTNRDVSTATVHTFSTRVDPEGKATSQARSGRCWLYV